MQKVPSPHPSPRGRGGVGENLLLGLNMNKIRKGDQVVVVTGKDKGKRGSVLRVLANDRVLVENINLVKKHTRPNPNKNVTGGIIEKEMSIHISNKLFSNRNLLIICVTAVIVGFVFVNLLILILVLKKNL